MFKYRIEGWYKGVKLLSQCEADYAELPEEDPQYEEESGWYSDIDRCTEFGIKRANGKKMLKESYIESGHDIRNGVIYLRIYSDKQCKFTKEYELIKEFTYEWIPCRLFEKNTLEGDYYYPSEY